MKEKIAIIGTGIAGMSAAYFLKDDYEVSLFEKNDYVGGHTHTVTLDKNLSFDSGFMVFNHPTYPLLTKLFKKLDVEIYDTDMSFSARSDSENIEYNGSSVNGLFSQRKNIFSPRFIRFLLQVNRFNKHSPLLLLNAEDEALTLEDYVKREGLGEDFLNWYLIPMSSAVWSTPPYKIKKFPIKALILFFKNHGFLGLNTQHTWKTVKGGSFRYRDKLIAHFHTQIKTSEAVESLRSVDANTVLLRSAKGEERFNKVVVACHADEALELLAAPSDEQRNLLSVFKYQKNVATLHTDTSVMPQLKKNWSSWNFISKEDGDYVVYYMNKLQRLATSQDYFISINGESYIDPSKIAKKIHYHHPIFDPGAWLAQRKLHELNKVGPLYFCGSYFRYGFHEDALWSSYELCKKILMRDPL